MIGPFDRESVDRPRDVITHLSEGSEEVIPIRYRPSPVETRTHVHVSLLLRRCGLLSAYLIGKSHTQIYIYIVCPLRTDLSENGDLGVHGTRTRGQ